MSESLPSLRRELAAAERLVFTLKAVIEQIEASALPPVPTRFDRKAYMMAYMREYMRKRREREKGERT